MDSITTYREIIKKTILQYAQFKPSHGNIRLDPVFDEPHDRYSLMQVGWDHGKRVKGNPVYITLQNKKVCIEYDGMEQGITDDLISCGIPEEKIVLSFLPAEAV